MTAITHKKLFAEIQTLRLYLENRIMDPPRGKRVKRVGRMSCFLVYECVNDGTMFVQSPGGRLYTATSREDAENLIMKDDRLGDLLHAISVNECQT